MATLTNWNKINHNLLRLIAKKLYRNDALKLVLVCKNWKRILSPYFYNHYTPRIHDDYPDDVFDRMKNVGWKGYICLKECSNHVFPDTVNFLYIMKGLPRVFPAQLKRLVFGGVISRLDMTLLPNTLQFLNIKIDKNTEIVGNLPDQLEKLYVYLKIKKRDPYIFDWKLPKTLKNLRLFSIIPVENVVIVSDYPELDELDIRNIHIPKCTLPVFPSSLKRLSFTTDLTPDITHLKNLEGLDIVLHNEGYTLDLSLLPKWLKYLDIHCYHGYKNLKCLNEFNNLIRFSSPYMREECLYLPKNIRDLFINSSCYLNEDLPDSVHILLLNNPNPITEYEPQVYKLPKNLKRFKCGDVGTLKKYKSQLELCKKLFEIEIISREDLNGDDLPKNIKKLIVYNKTKTTVKNITDLPIYYLRLVHDTGNVVSYDEFPKTLRQLRIQKNQKITGFPKTVNVRRN